MREPSAAPTPIPAFAPLEREVWSDEGDDEVCVAEELLVWLDRELVLDAGVVVDVDRLLLVRNWNRRVESTPIPSVASTINVSEGRSV